MSQYERTFVQTMSVHSCSLMTTRMTRDTLADRNSVDEDDREPVGIAHKESKEMISNSNNRDYINCRHVSL